MRRIQIKIWPEIVGQIPAIIPFGRIDANKTNPIDIDFSNVYDAKAAGLNLLLLNLLKTSSNVTPRDWDLKFSADSKVNQVIINSGFIKLLKKHIPNNNLFLQEEYLQINVEKEVGSDSQWSLKPIYELDFTSQTERRLTVELFKDYLVEMLEPLLVMYSFKANKFIQIMHEIAKNSADHTNQNAFFGIDIMKNTKGFSIQFSFGDLGQGINQSVREVIKNNNQYKSKHSHLAITDSYNFALRSGFTSKPDSILNRGIGMATIFDLSKQINLRLSVFDAQSRWLLSNATNISHSELRRIFYSVGFNVGFYYYGEVNHFINK